jgi:hypothetical protein
MTTGRLLRNLALVVAAATLVLASACGDESGGDSGSRTDAGGADQGSPSVVGCGEDAIELPDGLCYVEHDAGDGPEAKKGDIVEVHYTGRLTNGTVFDSSEGGAPIKFMLGIGQVIEGWDRGLAGMKVGGSRTLTIPPELGYGEAGYPPDIPPNATLVFDVELVSIESSRGKG